MQDKAGPRAGERPLRPGGGVGLGIGAGMMRTEYSEAEAVAACVTPPATIDEGASNDSTRAYAQ